MSVNMLGDRLMIDCQKRTKKGQPPHSTTGEARTSSIKLRAPCGRRRPIGSPGMRWPMAIASRGTVSIALTRKRRVMSASSGFAGSSAVIVRGSSAIPQIGQAPGAFRTISGCIGHVHSTAPGDGAGSAVGGAR
jgi:hypothetical protein